MPSLVLITPPASEPISLAEAKLHSRVEISTDDTLITDLIIAARELLETRLNRQIMPVTWDLYLEDFPRGKRFWPYDPVTLRYQDQIITVPKPTLNSVSYIHYYDSNGTLQTLDPSLYTVDTASCFGRIAQAPPSVATPDTTWPDTQSGLINSVIIRFIAGYLILPRCIKQACKLLVDNWYQNRSPGESKEMAYNALSIDALIRSQMVMDYNVR